MRGNDFHWIKFETLPLVTEFSRILHMSIFQKINHNQKFLWVWAFMITIALLCNQSVKLHIHDLDHAHDQLLTHDSAEGIEEHSHSTNAHLVFDNSHSEHHADIVAEIDTSLNAVLEKISTIVLTLAFLASIFAFLLTRFYEHKIYRRTINDTVILWRYHLSPPLRAPPS